MTIPKNGRPSPKRQPAKPQPTLRLVKAVVQPVFVLDDGESLHEVTVDPIQVTAANWAEWSKTVFSPKSLADVAKELVT